MSEEGKPLPRHRLWQPTTARWFFVIYGIALVYAVIRYHIAGDVPWQNFPLFIFNKATSLAAVAFVASAYLVGKVIRWYDQDRVLQLVVIKFCGLMGFFLAGVHALFSLGLLTPAYFAKYFNDIGRLNLQGELAIALGVFALFLLLGPAITTLPMMPKSLGGQRWKRNQRLGYGALLLVVIHLVVLGVKGWFEPSGWNGGLPPISLLAALIAVAPILVKRRRRKKVRRHTEPK